MVTEHEGRLVALKVHFNTDALEAKFDGWKGGFRELEENLKKEVVDYVNSKGQSFLAYLRGRGGEAGVRQDSDAEDPTFPLYQARNLTRNTKCPNDRGVYAVMIQAQISVCA